MSDYHAFKSTSGGSGGGGCSFRAVVIIALVYGFLTLLGQCRYG